MEKERTITTTINNKPITFQKNLSIKDVRYLINNIDDNNNYKQLFINMLKNKLPTFNSEDIENISSNEAINIINFFLSSSPKLKLMYSNSNEKNIYKRFITNAIKECEESYEHLKKIIETFNNDYFVNLNTTFKITINNAIENINNIVKKLPTNNEITLNIEKYKIWAEYGWVLGFNGISINDLDEIFNQQEADKIIMDIYNEELLNELFKSLRSTTDHGYLLHNAIKDYNDKNYLGCILIISSIIDRILSENFKPISPSRRIRATGKNGITALYQKYSENNDKYSFPEIYILESLKIVLDNFFHDAEDFTFKSKGIINRNLISHGWYDNEITKVDCLKLFHLLCSLQIVIFYKLYN